MKRSKYIQLIMSLFTACGLLLAAATSCDAPTSIAGSYY